MTHIGRLEGYGIGKESVRGTAVDPTIWVKQTEANLGDVTENVIDPGAVGVLMSSNGSQRAKKFAEGEISGILSTKAVGYWLLGLLGSVSSAETVGTGAYKHDFSMNNVNNKQSLTLSKKTPAEAVRYANAMVASFGISASVGEAVIMKAGVRAKAGASSTLTKAYAEDNTLYAKHVTIKIADTVAGLDAASALCIENVELNLTQELEDGFCFESGQDLDDIYNKGFAIDGTFTKIKQDTTYSDYVLNGDVKAMRIQIIDTGTTIGVADNPSVIIDIARVTFEDHEDEGGLEDIVRENLTFKGHYDLANSADIDVAVINEQSSY